MSSHPYAERFPVNRAIPEQGRSRDDILAELHTIAEEEDAFWETGKCSGTMYCGDHEHYDFMTETFGLFAHVNALQRDMCPSATRFEGEIIAMTLDMLHADAVTGTEPVGVVVKLGDAVFVAQPERLRRRTEDIRILPAPRFDVLKHYPVPDRERIFVAATVSNV